MSDDIVVVGDYNVSRADQILRVNGRTIFTSGDTPPADAELGSDSFGVDVDLVAIDLMFFFGIESVHEPGASPASNLNAVQARTVLTTQGSFQNATQPGTYWEERAEMHETLIVEDDTNQHGGGGQGDTYQLSRYLLDPQKATVDADLSPDAGQAMSLRAQLNQAPGAGNFDVFANADLYGRER